MPRNPKHPYRIPSIDVRTGRNATTTALRDDQWVKCWNCGYPNSTERSVRAQEGSRVGDGVVLPSTELSAAVATSDTTISVDSTSGFPSSGYIYIWDAASSRSTGTNCDRIAYTGTTGTTFTGCSQISRTHEIDDVVRGEPTVGMGCSLCGCLLYDR